MKTLLGVWVLALTAAGAWAQGISGTVTADDVRGLTVIACYVDAKLGCNEALSKVAEISSSGPSAPFAIEDLVAGQYLLIVWRDLDGNGDFDEVGDAFAIYTGPDGQTPAMVSPPASGIRLQLGQVPAAAPAAAAIPAELVGIWTYGSAAAGFEAITTGAYAGQAGSAGLLKLRADGSFEFSEYREGVLRCWVAILSTSSGRAVVQGGTLTLQPVRRHETRRGCDRENDYDRDVGLGPQRFAWSLDAGTTLLGWRTRRLTLLEEGQTYPDAYEQVRGAVPLAAPPVQAPSPFSSGQDTGYQELIGTWTAEADDPLDFYDPATGRFDPPGGFAAVIRFLDGGEYEFLGYYENLLQNPFCTKNVLYWERGAPRFAITGSDGYSVRGDLVFEARERRLIDQLADCEGDSITTTTVLAPGPSYFYWSFWQKQGLGNALSTEDRFELACPFGTEQAEWQFLLCLDLVQSRASYVRR